MHGLPVVVLIVPLLLLSACAASKPPKALLTDAQLEEVTGNSPEDESVTSIQSLAIRESPVFQNNDARINVVPIGPSAAPSFWSREPVPLGLR
jgi:hypothetical protein